MNATTSGSTLAADRDGAPGLPGTLPFLARRTLEHTVPAGTILFDQGEVPNFQVVVLSGSVQL
jgi:CRP/FNR family transcriptional activator FtrB